MGRTPLVEIIGRQIQHCRMLNPTDDDLVQFLTSNYSFNYSRTKRRQLEIMVRKARDRNNKRTREKLPAEEDGENDDSAEMDACATPSSCRRKKRKVDDSERKLILIEAERRRSYKLSEADSSEVSTSEDAIYGDKLEVKMDVMKDALREKYVKQAARVEEARGAEKQMEMEIDEKRGDKFVDGGKKGLRMRELDFDMETKKMEGPRFKDMGGVSKVLKDLIREVCGRYVILISKSASSPQ